MKEIQHTLGWFNVYDLGNKVYAISEAYKDTQSVSYLICGDNSSVLLDTGCGIGRMKKLVFQLTSLAPTVINSNTAPHHIGANNKFDLTHIFNHAHLIDTLTTPAVDQWIETQEKLCENNPQFAPALFTTFNEGTLFTLGNKTLAVVANAETAINGCMLADHENKMLFTGDIFHQPSIDALSDDQKTAYTEGCKKICSEYADYTWYFSNGTPVCENKKQAVLNHYA